MNYLLTIDRQRDYEDPAIVGPFDTLEALRSFIDEYCAENSIGIDDRNNAESGDSWWFAAYELGSQPGFVTGVLLDTEDN